MPLKRPNARMLARVSVRKDINTYYSEQATEAREATARKLTKERILAGTLSFGETFDPDSVHYLPPEERDEFVRLHGFIFITGGSGSHHANDPRDDIRDDEPYITADDADLDDSDYYEFSRVDPREYPYRPKSIGCRE